MVRVGCPLGAFLQLGHPTIESFTWEETLINPCKRGASLVVKSGSLGGLVFCVLVGSVEGRFRLVVHLRDDFGPTPPNTLVTKEVGANSQHEGLIEAERVEMACLERD